MNNVIYIFNYRPPQMNGHYTTELQMHHRKVGTSTLKQTIDSMGARLLHAVYTGAKQHRSKILLIQQLTVTALEQIQTKLKLNNFPASYA